MTNRERLINTLNGLAVDRPAVNFYEIGSTKYNPDDPDEFNVHNAPSWRELIELAENRTDIIRLIGQRQPYGQNDIASEFLKIENWQQGRSKFTKKTISISGNKLTELSRRDADTDTVWKLEHFIKTIDDLRAFVEVPIEVFDFEYDCEKLLGCDVELGDRGIAGFDTADPLCFVADLFSMEDFTIFALTEQKLMHRLLSKFASLIYPKVETAVEKCPGRLWRIVGPEYASEPYLPPSLFDEYVVGYDTHIVELIHKTGGFARIHSHGRLKNILPLIVKTGADGLDPIEPPMQGDVELRYVREKYGENLVLFGNLEITDIENLPPSEFEEKVRIALEEGTMGSGRGFVLMPSASPYGRVITENTLENYKTMVLLTENFLV